jgi:hypothetical protein
MLGGESGGGGGGCQFWKHWNALTSVGALENFKYENIIKMKK